MRNGQETLSSTSTAMLLFASFFIFSLHYCCDAVQAFVVRVKSGGLPYRHTVNVAVFDDTRSIPRRAQRPSRAVSCRRAQGTADSEDDQRVFWDVVVKELRRELGGQGLDESRVWDFVRHNRDGLLLPASLPSSYLATGLYFPGLEARPWWDSAAGPKGIVTPSGSAQGRRVRGQGIILSYIPKVETGRGRRRSQRRGVASFSERSSTLPKTDRYEAAEIEIVDEDDGGIEHYDRVKALECATPDITNEMAALLRESGGKIYAAGTGEMSTVYDSTKGWGTMRFRYMGRYDQPGIDYSLLSRTLSVLRKLPLAPETAAFQRQLPGTGLPLHVDPSNFVLGLHLGVVIPDMGKNRYTDAVATKETTTKRRISGSSGDRSEDHQKETKEGRIRNKTLSGADRGFDERRFGTSSLLSGTDGLNSMCPGQSDEQTSDVLEDDFRSTEGGLSSEGHGGERERAWIEVAGEKREWDTGRAFVFDPSFLHRTHNPTSEERVILNVDIWHPGLADVEIRAIEMVCEFVEQWNARTGIFA